MSRVAGALEDIACQKRRQTLSTLLKPITRSTLIFDRKNEKLELFEEFFQTKLKMQPEKSELMKFSHFHSHFLTKHYKHSEA